MKPYKPNVLIFSKRQKESNEKHNEFICPECKSLKIVPVRTYYLTILSLFLLGLGAWMLFLPLVGIIILVCGLSVFTYSFLARKYYYCLECYHIWSREYENTGKRRKNSYKIIDFHYN